MFDIGDKDVLVAKIMGSIQSFYINRPSRYGRSEIEQAIEERIYDIVEDVAKKVACTAAREIITHLYTCSEFEKDLGLKK